MLVTEAGTGTTPASQEPDSTWRATRELEDPEEANHQVEDPETLLTRNMSNFKTVSCPRDEQPRGCGEKTCGCGKGSISKL
uniref:Uncharacterized protein n=1 Tax=Cannabis sativa TaxID=3483 RepID=A0A803PYL9_CANSA